MPLELHLPLLKKRWHKTTPLTLTYHNISSGIHLGFNSIHPQNFHRHMEYLYKYFLDKKEATQAVISFDDGYESVFKHAYPILSQYDFKRIVFPVSGFIGKDNEWDINFIINRTKHMNKAHLREISDNGWEIGSHGHMHRSCHRMNNDEIRKDLSLSKALLEEITGKSVLSLAPPFGTLSDCYLKAAEEIGFERIFIQHSLFKTPIYTSKLDIINRKSVYSIDSPNAVLRKAQNSNFELYKENIIHYFSNATIAVKEML